MGRTIQGIQRSVDPPVRSTLAYLHGLYPPARGPFPRPAAEQERIGLTARVKPGAKLPFTVAWRLPRGAGVPVKIDYGLGWLPVPLG